MSLKVKSNGINFNVPTIEDLPTERLEEDLVCVVTDENRGGVFVYREVNALINDGGTIFNGWTRQYDDGAVNIKWFGAKGDGITDDTVAIQNAINSSIDIEITSGTYATTGITIPISSNKSIKGIGQPILKAMATAVNIIFIETDVTRSAQTNISGIVIDGNLVTNVTGVRQGGESGAKLYNSIHSCTIMNCYIGIDMYTSMECSLENTTTKLNTVGIVLRQSMANGGATANLFKDVGIVNNTIGLMVLASSPYPMQHNKWVNCAIQANMLCGIYINGTDSNIVFDGCHIEANGGGVSSSLSVLGYTVLKSSLHMDNAKALFNCSNFSETISPCILVNNNSVLTLNNSGGYGNSSGIFAQSDSTYSLVIIDGIFDALSEIRANSLIGGIVTTSSKSALTVVDKKSNIVDSMTNLFGTEPLAPLLQNASGATINANILDSEFGYVSNVSFLASVGSTSSNRVTVNIIPSYVGSKYYTVSFLVKASVSTKIIFNVTSGSYVMHECLVSTSWKRVVLSWYSTATTAPLLYIYPSDTSGATVYIARIQVSVSDSKYSTDIQRAIHGDISINRKTDVYATAAPTTGIWKVGETVYNTSPTAGGFIGWVCTTAGTPGTWKTFGAITA